jgi:Cell wall-active antibiotics response 4TMS YvqF
MRGAIFRALDPYRCIVIGGRARRAGRIRIGRFCTAIVAFGQLELDLRAARLSQDEITLTVISVAGRVTVLVPAGWRVTDEVLVIGKRRAIADHDGDEQAPLLRLRGAALCASFLLSED